MPKTATIRSGPPSDQGSDGRFYEDLNPRPAGFHPRDASASNSSPYIHPSTGRGSRQGSQPLYPQGLSGLWDLLGIEVGSYQDARGRHEPAGILDRTQRNRLHDHVLLLRDIRRNEALAKYLDCLRRHQVFIDVGPAVGNFDTPAQSSMEVALEFPDIDVVCVDEARAIDQFRRNISKPSHQRLQAQSNLAVTGADCQSSLHSILARPTVTGDVPVVDAHTFVTVRVANSLDIYEPQEVSEELFGSVAEEYRLNPILFLFNRGILIKSVGSTDWRLIGAVSSRGFNHRTRTLAPYGPSFDVPYELF